MQGPHTPNAHVGQHVGAPGEHGAAQTTADQASAAAAAGAPAGPNHGDTAYVTGAYQLSGNYMIDRMIQLERALKTYAR